MSLADDLRAENEALTRRFLYHTRKPGPLTLDEAQALCEAVDASLVRQAAHVIPAVPETKTFERIGVDTSGREVGWIKPGPLDPYSEPYLAAIDRGAKEIRDAK